MKTAFRLKREKAREVPQGAATKIRDALFSNGKPSARLVPDQINPPTLGVNA
jgi:hypothetical protein